MAERKEMNVQRDEMISFIEGVNPSAGSKLRTLIEKKQELVEECNKYGEKFTERQFWLAVDPIVRAEYRRSRILQTIKERALSVKEIAEETGLPSKEVFQHVVALRRRNLVRMDRVEGTSPKYLALIEEVAEA